MASDGAQNAQTRPTTPRHAQTHAATTGRGLCVLMAREPWMMVFVFASTCGLVAMTSASHAEGRQFDPGQVYLCAVAAALVEYTPGQDRTGDLQRVRLTS